MDEDLLNGVVKATLRAGASAAEAVFAEHASLSVGVRLGALEEVEREESTVLGVRVFVGARQASVSGSDISAEGRARLVERVMAMARLAAEDPYAGLAPKEVLSQSQGPELDLFDPSEPDAETLETLARAAEASALAVPGVTNSGGGSASWSASAWRLTTSSGFVGSFRASASSISAQAIAGEGGEMEQAGEGRANRWRDDLPAPELVGAEAGRRAVSALGARKIASTTAPVIFENRLSSSLLGPFIGAISGPAVARGVSFLKDRLGARVFPAGVTITDDPHRRRGLGSAPFDDEGAANKAMAIIDDGVLTTWLLNASAARQLGLTTTGHAARGLAAPPGVGVTNLTLQPGAGDQAALMAEASKGLLVTAMFGPSLNANTGDWSVGCSGFWFEGGELAYPVTEITVAGNLIDIYGRLRPGGDLEIRGRVNAPSVLVDALSIAGL
ncbi:MAG TPA: metallopeptidase TldD-related protein [Caulobacteraceae bacterium]|jgi:PmbA protein